MSVTKSFDANVTYEEESGQIMSMVINPYAVQPPTGNRTLSQIITDIGLGANLALALDAGDSASVKDQYFSSNVLLLHCDGSDASTTFTDSAKGKTVTAVGNVQIDTAQSKFGVAAAVFNGSDDYLTNDGSADFAFGTGAFTIEFWLRLTTPGVARVLYDSRPAATNGLYPTMWITSTNVITFFVNSLNRITGTTALAADVWHHVAVSRSGTSTKLFLNGTQEGSTYTDSNDYLNGASRPTIGTNGNDVTLNELVGWLDDIRVTKGVARYTANFTAPTAAHPDGKWENTAGTSFDFHRGATEIIEANDPTFNGTAGGLSSAEYWSFDGGDFFTYENTNEAWMESLHQNNAAYTLVFFIYVGSLAADQRLFATLQNFAADTGLITTISTAGDFILHVENAGTDVANFQGAGATAGAWHFIAWSVDEAAGANGALSVLNGVVVDTATSTYSSPSAGSATGTLHIGSSSTGGNPLSSGSRLGMVAAWSRALTAAELANLNASVRGRYL